MRKITEAKTVIVAYCDQCAGAYFSVELIGKPCINGCAVDLPVGDKCPGVRPSQRVLMVKGEGLVCPDCDVENSYDRLYLIVGEYRRHWNAAHMGKAD